MATELSPFPGGSKFSPWIEIAAAVCMALYSFVNKNIWDPALTYFMLIVLLIFHHASEVAVDKWIRKNVDTFKNVLFGFTLAAVTSLVWFAFQFGKHEPALFFLPQAIFCGTAFWYLLALIKNLSLLGVLPEQLAKVLIRNINTHKNNYTNANPDTQPQQTHSEPAGALDSIMDAPADADGGHE